METQASVTAEAVARPASAAQGMGPDPAADAGSEAQLPPPSGVKEALSTLWEDARGALSERFKLVSLELRLATMTLMQVIVLSVVVAVLAVTCWLLLVAGIVAGFVSAGLHWAIALALLIAINVGVAYFLVKLMIRLIERVSLPKGLRRRSASTPTPEAG